MRFSRLLMLVLFASCVRERAEQAVDQTDDRSAWAKMLYREDKGPTCREVGSSIVCDNTRYGYSFERGTAQPIGELEALPRLIASAELPTVVFEVMGDASSEEARSPYELAAERARTLRQVLIDAGISATRIYITAPHIHASYSGATTGAAFVSTSAEGQFSHRVFDPSNRGSICTGHSGLASCSSESFSLGFEPNSATPRTTAPEWLSALSDVASRFPTVTFDVYGTATVDESASAKAVANQRAKAVAQILLGAGVNDARISRKRSRVITDKRNLPDRVFQRAFVSVVGDFGEPISTPAVGYPSYRPYMLPTGYPER